VRDLVASSRATSEICDTWPDKHAS
jgi:hypothetical protein